MDEERAFPPYVWLPKEECESMPHCLLADLPKLREAVTREKRLQGVYKVVLPERSDAMLVTSLGVLPCAERIRL